MSIQHGAWGYDKQAIANGAVYSLDELINYLANSAVRNMSFLLNISPDRHGVIPQIHQQRLREMGAWLKKAGDAIYGTRGGPWEPVEGQYGYTYKDSTIFAHLLKGYAKGTFRVPPMGELRVEKVYDVFTGAPLDYTPYDGGIEVNHLNRESSPADTIIAIVYDQPVANVWK